MSGYAVRNDGLGFRAVTSPADCTPSETFSATLPVLNLPPLPDNAGFAQAIKTALGGILPANMLAASYPLFFSAVETQVWPDVQAIIVDANTKALLTAAQYTAIKSAATTYHIPITLL